MGVHDDSKIKYLQFTELHLKDDEPTGSQVSVQANPKRKCPKYRKDIELPLEGNQDDKIADLPQNEETVRYILYEAQDLHGASGS